MRLEIVHGVYGFGSAGELRLMVPNPKKKTEALNATIKLDSTQNDNKVEEPDAGVELPQTGWTVKASSVNTQDDGVTPRESDQKLIDGDLTTYWHSKISPKDPAPFEVLLTLPEVTSVSGFRYYPRQGGGAGICTKFELHASADGKTFYKMDEGTWENSTKAKTISFVGNVKVKAFKFIILEGVGGFGSGGELKLLEAKTGERLTPSVLSKRLVKYAEVLEQNGIRVVSERTRTTRTLSILCLPCDGSDGSDGKN